MKKFIFYIFLMLATVSLDHFLTAIHDGTWDAQYEDCKHELIEANNYHTRQQAFDCANTKSTLVRVLGTLLWSGGSYL